MRSYNIYDQLTTGMTLIFGLLLIVFQFFPELKEVNLIRNEDNQQVLHKAIFANWKDTIPILHQGRSVYRSKQNDIECHLKIDQGRIVIFSINGEVISKPDYENYSNIIMALQRNVNPVPRPGSQFTPAPPPDFKSSAGNSFEAKLTEKLMKDGLIKSADDYSFELTLKKMVVDGKVMSGVLLKNYIRFLESAKDEKIIRGSSYAVIKRP